MSFDLETFLRKMSQKGTFISLDCSVKLIRMMPCDSLAKSALGHTTWGRGK